METDGITSTPLIDEIKQTTPPPTPSIVRKKWINKDGSITEKEYNQTAYSKKHYEKNKDKYLGKTLCGCGIEYSPSNKHNHFITRIHKLYEKMSANAISI
jgi:hypothetical protein